MFFASCVLLLECNESDAVDTDNTKGQLVLGELANSCRLEGDGYRVAIKRTVEVRLAHRRSPEQLKASTNYQGIRNPKK